MGYHIRKALVHFAAVTHYLGKKHNFANEWEKLHINWDVESAEVSLKEALRLGESLAVKFPGDRGVTRDRILTHYHLATLAKHFKDAYGAGEHLRAARQILDSIVKAGPFPLIHWMDWMDLPNLDAAMGDWAADSGDKAGARDWYRKAIDIETQILARRPGDGERPSRIVASLRVRCPRSRGVVTLERAAQWSLRIRHETRLTRRTSPPRHDRQDQDVTVRTLVHRTPNRLADRARRDPDGRGQGATSEHGWPM
jgi:hypothetical protein